jgi:thermitase
MKAIANILFGAVALSLAACANPATGSAAKTSASSSVATAPRAQAAYSTLDETSVSAWQAAVQAGEVRPGAVLVKTGPAFESSSLSSLGATQNGSLAGLGGTWRHLAVAAGSEESAMIALRKIPGVLAAVPELRLHLPENEIRTKAPGLPVSISSGASSSARSAARALTTSTVLDDPYVFSAEYNLSITKAIAAYASYRPSPSAPVYAAVLDTGLNFPHQDFHDASGNSIVALAKSAFRRNSAASYTYFGDGNPFYQLSPSDLQNNWDDDGHGTHVSGILGAVGNNGLGIAGVMWSGLRLISYKVLTDNESDSAEGSGGDWAIYGALEDLTAWWMANHGSQTTLPVNMSLGGYYASPFEAEMLTYALQNNVVVIAAMGNDGKTLVEYPAAYTGVIAVGATDGDDTIAPFSTSGGWISVVAPGLDILSTYNGSSSDYEYDSGTSMATPFVTGLSAYALAFAPTLLPDQVKTVLMGSADLVAGNKGGFSNTYGAGRVDVLNTVTNAVTSPPASGSVYSAQPVTITLTVAGKAAGNIAVYLYDNSGDYIEDGYTGSDGTISFWLLKPGSYQAEANDGFSSGSTGSINLPAGASSPATGTISLQS